MKSKTDKIIELMKVLYPMEAAQNILENLKKNVLNFGVSVPKSFDSLLERIPEFCDDLNLRYAKIYDSYYSEEDIDVLLKFYSSETSKKQTKIFNSLDRTLFEIENVWIMDCLNKIGVDPDIITQSIQPKAFIFNKDMN